MQTVSTRLRAEMIKGQVTLGDNIRATGMILGLQSPFAFYTVIQKTPPFLYDCRFYKC